MKGRWLALPLCALLAGCGSGSSSSGSCESAGSAKACIQGRGNVEVRGTGFRTGSTVHVRVGELDKDLTVGDDGAFPAPGGVFGFLDFAGHDVAATVSGEAADGSEVTITLGR